MNVVEKFVTWCGSFAGILTILLIVITAGRMILTAIREKKGEKSTFYRNAKTLSSLFYAVCILNGVAMLVHNIAANSSRPTGVDSYSLMLVIVGYIIAYSVALKYDKYSIIWIACVVAIFSFQQSAFHQMGVEILLVGLVFVIFSVICSACIECHISNKKLAAEAQAKRAEQLRRQQQQQKLQQQLQSEAQHEPEEVDLGTDELGKSHKGLILTLLWIASLVAAYLAGEYSLIPKLVEFLQKHAEAMKTKKDAKEDANAAESTALIVVDNN